MQGVRRPVSPGQGKFVDRQPTNCSLGRAYILCKIILAAVISAVAIAALWTASTSSQGVLAVTCMAGGLHINGSLIRYSGRCDRVTK